MNDCFLVVNKYLRSILARKMFSIWTGSPETASIDIEFFIRQSSLLVISDVGFYILNHFYVQSTKIGNIRILRETRSISTTDSELYLILSICRFCFSSPDLPKSILRSIENAFTETSEVDSALDTTPISKMLKLNKREAAFFLAIVDSYCQNFAKTNRLILTPFYSLVVSISNYYYSQNSQKAKIVSRSSKYLTEIYCCYLKNQRTKNGGQRCQEHRGKHDI